jgi:hypothetical protein
MRATFLFVAVAGLALSSQAADKRDLALLAAKAAAAVKRVIPGSQAEVQGSTALVKKRTALAPNMQMQGSHVMQGSPDRIELPDAYGVMFVIRFQPAPYSGPPLARTPVFDRQRAKAEKLFRGAYYRTAVIQEFPKSNTAMIVDVMFGEYTDTQMLQQAYAELTRFAESEL